MVATAAARARSVHVAARLQSVLGWHSDLKSRPLPWTTHGPPEPVSGYLQNLSTRPYFFPSFSLFADVHPSAEEKARPSLGSPSFHSFFFSFCPTLPSCCYSSPAHFELKVIMLASRQLLGVARSRAAAGLGRRCMATATEHPLDRKVSPVQSLQLHVQRAQDVVARCRKRAQQGADMPCLWETGQAEPS